MEKEPTARERRLAVLDEFPEDRDRYTVTDIQVRLEVATSTAREYALIWAKREGWIKTPEGRSHMWVKPSEPITEYQQGELI